MADIITSKQIGKYISDYKDSGKKIVLVGGCFDILHIGHIKFLQEAKSMGDRLIVLLESDKKVKMLKGENKPVFDQAERALVLSSISSVDLVITLDYIQSDSGYDQIIDYIKPDIIALTQNDKYEDVKKKQAKKVLGKLKVIPYIKTYSSSKLAKILGIE